MVHFLLSYGMYLLFLMVSTVHKKAAKWIAGRKNYFQKLERNLPQKEGKRIWVHCASLGEFEQARPIIERWLQENTGWKLILTFFSPSGYEIRKDYALAEWVGYFPLDTPKNANKFLNQVKPDMVLFVKYEFWYFHLREVIHRNIPLLLVSATIRESHYIFKFYGAKTQKLLKKYSQIFLQDKKSYDLLEQAGFTNISLSGDTRYDRVINQAKLDEKLPKIEQWKAGEKVLILGSSWSEEEEIIAHYFKENPSAFKLLIAPHDISESHLKEIEEKFGSVSRYSAMEMESKVILVDSIGLLSRMYKYGDIAVVGGGFGRGLHNILEPMAFGLPTFYGPQHEKFPEGDLAKKAGVGFNLYRGVNFKEKLPSKNQVQDFIKKNSGATDKVLEKMVILSNE